MVIKKKSLLSFENFPYWFYKERPLVFIHT